VRLTCALSPARASVREGLEVASESALGGDSKSAWRRHVVDVSNVAAVLPHQYLLLLAPFGQNQRLLGGLP
jgi:hypothetical protein